jgi:hypothetical protein
MIFWGVRRRKAGPELGIKGDEGKGSTEQGGEVYAR